MEAEELHSERTLVSRMTNLAQLSPVDVAAVNQQLQAQYDAFKAKGLKLNLTRGKPSPAQLDLSQDLLSLPGPQTLSLRALSIRNYGGLQGSWKCAGCSPECWAHRLSRSW